MKERPILFSAPMVRAILEGRKTQTRRALRKQFAPDAEPAEVPATSPEGWQISGHSGLWWDDAGACIDDAIRCPYGQPGDRLWVRETWAEVGTCDPGLIVYRADYPLCVARHYENVPTASEIRWRPSIHQRREHSRILLEITSVRVERLNDISEADAQAEGAPLELAELERLILGAKAKYRSGFVRLWQSINGEQSWHANPWVWVIGFKRVQP